MTSRDAFKFGFLYRCAEEGLGADEAERRAAAFEKCGLIGGAISAGQGGLDLMRNVGSLLTTGTAMGLGGAMLTGAIGGWGAAKLREDDTDVDDVKQQELIDAYNRASDEAIQRRRVLGRPAPGMFGASR